MPSLCFTADLDRDVNVPIPGRLEAGSIDRGAGTSPRFTSAGRGLSLLTGLLDELSIPAMFFVEARTLMENRELAGCLDGYEVGVHGFDHEDFSLLDETAGSSILTDSMNVIKDISGTLPVAIRFPYMRRPSWTGRIIPGLGLKYDSSIYSEGPSCRPRSDSGFTELPVFVDKIGTAGKTAYLWPLHEGRCTPEEYLDRFRGFPEDSILVISDHCWHIVESRFGGICGDPKQGLEDVRRVLELLEDFGFTTISFSEAVMR